MGSSEVSKEFFFEGVQRAALEALSSGGRAEIPWQAYHLEDRVFIEEVARWMCADERGDEQVTLGDCFAYFLTTDCRFGSLIVVEKVQEGEKVFFVERSESG